MRRRCPGCRQTRATIQFQAGNHVHKSAVSSRRQESRTMCCGRWTGGKRRTQQTCAMPRYIKRMMFS